MSDSESSSDVTVKYQHLNGKHTIENKLNDKKPQSTDTDYYFNMIANPSKINNESVSSSESSEIADILADSNSDKSSIKSKNSSKSSIKSKSSRSTSNYSAKQPLQFEQQTTFKPPSEHKNNQYSFKQNNDINTQTKSMPQTIAPSIQQTDIKSVEKILTPQETRMKKIELLRKLCEIKAKGYQLSKEYDFNSSLEEMEYEYELLRSFADKRNGVKIFKNGLLQAVSVIEFLNDRYDPFDFHLSGWGEHMSVEVDSWEDVLEEIYEKYKGSGRKMAPEIKLLYLIIASASAFHFSKTHAAKLPGLDSVLSANPGLLSKLINPGKKESSQFMTPQEINIEKQKEELRKKEMETKMMQQQQINQLQEQLRKQNEVIAKQQNMINQKTDNKLFEPGISSSIFSVQNVIPINAKAETLPPTIPVNLLKPNIPNIRAPENVKEILNRIHNIQPNNIKTSNTDTQEDTTSNNDRLVSEMTISENNSKKRGRKPKKAGLSII